MGQRQGDAETEKKKVNTTCSRSWGKPVAKLSLNPEYETLLLCWRILKTFLPAAFLVQVAVLDKKPSVESEEEGKFQSIKRFPMMDTGLSILSNSHSGNIFH